MPNVPLFNYGSTRTRQASFRQIPLSAQDWLPERHLACFVVHIVDQLDLSELENRYGAVANSLTIRHCYLPCCFTVYATEALLRLQAGTESLRSVAFCFIMGKSYLDPAATG